MREPLIVLSVVLMSLSSAVHAQDVTPLPQAHAHNDYHHQRPLHDALDCGFTSVEADIFLVDGELLIGHDRSELRPERTLQKLYLDPLREWVVEHDGHVYAEEMPFELLLDIKTRGKSTYEALDHVLAGYAELFTRVEKGEVIEGPIRAVVSGNRSRQVIDADETRFVGVDGRLSNLGDADPPHLLPWISDRWGSHFKWDGKGEMPSAEKEKLKQIVQQAHAEGRAVRFWATPETHEMWEVLADAGVDKINTDDLDGLQDFLIARNANQ
ncbi:MAG: phosphatidylinositol-specific phospholipase C/glycerophosphodiester phosphodiesterase family protein [Planctomycetaceae bacterium]|nr:phosphatidylinositol-specific phospholipase C/glycerophosphodiester phosphodiesterase family protein [Planctomycetaceae bacterium]